MNRLLIILFLVIVADVRAQWTMLPLDSVVDGPNTWSHRITVEGTYLYNSNTIYNELPASLLVGDDLDRDLRQRTSDALVAKERAVLGSELTGRITWTGARGDSGRARLRPIVSFAHQEYTGARITPDLYDLVFFGNARFEGGTANLAPSGYEQVRYQTLGGGVADTRSRSFVRLDLVLGQSYAAADIRWADLYTATDGRLLRSSIAGTFHSSDTAGNEWGRNNGMGAALTGRWEARIRAAARPTCVSLSVEDLGFLTWNDRAVQLQKDTIVRYEGLAVENILDLDQLILGEDQLLDTFGIAFDAGSFTTVLPFRVGAEIRSHISDRWHVGLAAQYQHLPYYIPQVTASVARRSGERLLWGGSLSYGGYGGLLVGLGGRYRFSDHFTLEASLPQVIGLTLGRSRGVGALLSAQLSF